MVQIDRRLLFVATGVGCFAVATFAIVYANAWWLSALLTLSIGCWLTGVLWTVYSPPERRTAAVGALVTSFLYVLFAGGPWFQAHVGPWLLTTRALVAIDTHVLGHEPPAADRYQVVLTQGGGFPYPLNTGYTGYPVPPATGLWTVPQPASGAAAVRPTVAVGHWLFAWCAAAIGGCGAAWIARRTAKPRTEHARAAPVVPIASGGPFAETVR